MFDDIELEEVSRAHANELNKSIDKISQNVLIGLALIAVAIYVKR